MRVVELDLVDTTRTTPAVGGQLGSPQRKLPTTIYAPTDRDAAPLIVLAHGLNGHPRKFTRLATHWAEAGYVVAVPRFPVSSDEFAVLDPDVYKVRIADLPEQATDVAFVIGEVRRAGHRGELACGIDGQRLGLYGLSLGSLTVWSTIARLDSIGVRVDCLIQSDGGFPGELASLAAVPFPVLAAHSDVDPIFPIERVRSQFGALPTPKYLLVLHGAAHAEVGENTVTPADEVYRIATTVFWDRYLGGHADAAFPPDLTTTGVTTFVDGS
jgi:predicted dienelactone hydrolase